MNLKNFLLVLVFCGFQVYGQQQTVADFQKELNAAYLDPLHSPLSDEDRKAFKGHDFFPVKDDFRVKASFVRTPYESIFGMPTSDGRHKAYVKYGEVHFEIAGKAFKLNVYQSQQLREQPQYADYLFLPFTDQTNGISTYEGGRYLDMRIPDGSEVVLDFNKAYNPYCAYSGNYSCPIPPPENHLEIPVKAGVRLRATDGK